MTVATWISGSEPNCHPAFSGILVLKFLSSEGRPSLTLEEDGLGSLKEFLLGFGCRDGIHFAVSCQPVTWVVGVANCPQQGRYVGFLPYRWRRFQPVRKRSTAMYGSLSSITYLSPRKSITYASTPPGIFTSTRTSTREKALKQLQASQDILDQSNLERKEACNSLTNTSRCVASSSSSSR